MSDIFYTIDKRGEGEFKDRGSKFFGLADQVNSDEEIATFLNEVKKKYHDARHHCFAFRLGTETVRERANDDGEPGHSAGDPILGQIKSANLTNCLVVVVRYFGGTKLGVPGLINAYRTAAASAIEEADLVEIIPKISVSLKFSYESLGVVEKWMTDFECEDIIRDFQTQCEIQFQIKDEIFGRFKEAMKDHYTIKLTQDDG